MEIVGHEAHKGLLEECQRKTKEANLDDIVHFYGRKNGQDRMMAYHDADIYVFPSWSEGCPNSALEAMGSGLYVVGSTVGALPDIAPLQLPPPPGLLCEWGVMLPPGLKKQLREWLVARPVLKKEKCVGCGLCAKLCPPASLKIKDGKACFDYPNCIRCFCCQEHCPQGAITIRKGVLMGFMETMERIARKIVSR